MVKEIETEKLKRTKFPFIIHAIFSIFIFMLILFIVIPGERGATHKELNENKKYFILLSLLGFIIYLLSPLILIIPLFIVTVYLLFIVFYENIQFFHTGIVKNIIENKMNRDSIIGFIVLLLLVTYSLLSSYLIFSKRYKFPYTFKDIYNIL